MSTEWLLLVFNDNYADEFDCSALIVTTRDRWAHAGDVLRTAYPDYPDGGKGFEASFGSNESITYRCGSDYLNAFKEHTISLECARGLAKAIRRYDVVCTWDGAQITSVEGVFVIEHGVLPRVPDDVVGDWLCLLGFKAPPRQHAHDSSVQVINTPDPAYIELMGGP